MRRALFQKLRELFDHRMFKIFFLVSLFIILNAANFAQNLPCKFDEKTLQFRGSKLQQAKCLLRPNKIYGVLGDELKNLPKPLEKLLGRNSVVEKSAFQKFLFKNSISENDLGGSLNLPLSSAMLPNNSKIQALYFVIHDASYPYYGDEEFPKNFDADKDWKGNKLEVWLKNPVAHVFVNRLGESVTTTPFEESARKGWGTKFAREFLKADAKGLQLHIELIQPRRRHPSGGAKNDAIAPVPGFTDAQYQRLALLYIAAGIRRGDWLIPAYHSAIDAGIKDAHDDPQNFELDKFSRELKKILNELKYKV